MAPRRIRRTCLALRLAGAAPAAAAPFAYISNLNQHQISVFDAAIDEVVTTIPTPYYPYSVAVAPDGQSVYAAAGCSGLPPSCGSGLIHVIDAVTHTVQSTAPAGDGPVALVLHPNGNLLFALNYVAGVVSRIDLTLGSVTGSSNSAATATAASRPAATRWSREPSSVTTAMRPKATAAARHAC